VNAAHSHTAVCQTEDFFFLSVLMPFALYSKSSESCNGFIFTLKQDLILNHFQSEIASTFHTCLQRKSNTLKQTLYFECKRLK